MSTIKDAIVKAKGVDILGDEAKRSEAPEDRTMERGHFPHFEEESRAAETSRMEGGFPPHLRRGPTRPKPRGLSEAVGKGPRMDHMFDVLERDERGNPTTLSMRKHAQLGVALHIKQAIERTCDRYDIMIPVATREAIYAELNRALEDGACRYVNGSYNCQIVKEEAGNE